jgi:hypothetical protein
MNLRAAIAGIVFSAVLASPAIAQEAQESATPNARVVELSPEHIAVGDNLFRAIVIDGGGIDRIFEIVETDMIPDLRANMLRSPIYRGASAERREALMVIVDNLPNFMRQEIVIALNSVGPRIAPRFAQHMSREHLDETADFMRSPEMRERWRAMVDERAEKDTPMPNFPQWRSVGDFAQTPAGQAFAREEEALGVILTEETDQTFTIVFPRMLTVIAGQMCDALGDECPPNIRDAAGRT